MLIVTTKESFDITGSYLFRTKEAKAWSRPRGARSLVISMSCGDNRGCLLNEGQ